MQIIMIEGFEPFKRTRHTSGDKSYQAQSVTFQSRLHNSSCFLEYITGGSWEM